MAIRDKRMKNAVALSIEVERVKKRWNQCDLAAKVGITQSDLSDVENGKGMDLDKLRAIAQALGLPLSRLIQLAEETISQETNGPLTEIVRPV